MPLEKLLAFTKDVSDLSDKPNSSMTAAEVKAWFDAAPDEVRVYLNQLIDNLQSVVDGDSGADNVGTTNITGLNGATVQALLESLKALDDENRAYLLSQINGVVLGQIPDETITHNKFSPTNKSVVPHGTTTGVANAYAVNLNPAPSSYFEGMAVSVTMNVDSTGPSTLNVNGLGPIPLKKDNGLDKTNFKKNGVYTFRYNSMTVNFILQGEGGEYGTAEDAQVLAGYTVGRETGVVSGTMVNNGSGNIQASETTDIIIPVGYYNGGKVLTPRVVAGGVLIYDRQGLSGFNNVRTKKMEVLITKPGVYRVTMTIRTTDPATTTGQAQIYVNDIAVGINRTGTSASDTTFTEDITVNVNDKLQLYTNTTGIGANCPMTLKLYIQSMNPTVTVIL